MCPRLEVKNIMDLALVKVSNHKEDPVSYILFIGVMDEELNSIMMISKTSTVTRPSTRLRNNTALLTVACSLMPWISSMAIQ